MLCLMLEASITLSPESRRERTCSWTIFRRLFKRKWIMNMHVSAPFAVKSHSKQLPRECVFILRIDAFSVLGVLMCAYIYCHLRIISENGQSCESERRWREAENID